MQSATVAISAGFLEAYAKLPRKIQQKASSFIMKFRNDPNSPGINYEKISAADQKIYSVRIDDTYRGIVAREQETGVYLLLWVDHHDEAYRWARSRKCSVNSATGAIQIYEVREENGAEPASAEKMTLFGSVGRDNLIEFGVPEELVDYVESIADIEEFEQQKKILPTGACEWLEWIANGFGVDEIIDLLKSEREEQKEVDGTLASALSNPETKQSFVVVEGEEELYQILSAPLEKWRVFLHPSQRKIVHRRYNGPARVLGGAGTGKTVVAMHRAKELAANLASTRGRILFTTFSTTLASDIRANLKKICNTEELRRIDVINLDSWVAQYLKAEGFEYSIEYEQSVLEGVWEQAILDSDTDLDFAPGFYADEWGEVVLAQENLSLSDYAHAKRAGRGVRLGRKERVSLWGVIEEYRRLMRERGIRDVDAAMYEARMVLERDGDSPRYSHVVVDEGQDFSAPAYRLIRALVGAERENDIFIVGDSHQRIYNRKAVLSRCGINIRGRSSVLRINYRTTEEIRQSAMAVLSGLSFDDLDDGIDDDPVTQSLVHGEKPEVYIARDLSDEMDYLASEIKALIESGSDERDICISARTNTLVDEYAAGLSNRGIRVMKLKARKADDRSIDGVRVATMHRVKGLEFGTVFLAGMAHGTVPLSHALKRSRIEGNEEALMQSERSLVYVAMTRAKQKTIITSPGRLTALL